MGFFTEVGARMGLDITPFKAGLAQSATALGEFKRRAGKNLDVGDAGKAFAFALGLSIDKVGDTFARMWTGVTKEAEQAFKDIDQLSAENTEATIQNMRELLSLEQRYQLLLRDRARIQNNPTSVEKTEAGFGERLLASIAFGMNKVLPGSGKPFTNAAYSMLQSRLAENQAQKVAAAEKGKLAINQKDAEIMRIESELRKKIMDLGRKTLENDRASLGTQAQLVKAHEDLLEIDRVIAAAKPEEALDLQIARADKVRDIRELTTKNENELKTAADKAAQAMERQQKAAEKVSDATTNAAKAWMQLQQAKDDQTAFSIDELAAGGKGILQRDKARAKEVLRLEADAKRQRGLGMDAEAESSMEKARALRDSLGVMKADDRDPLRSQKERLTDALQDIDKAKRDQADMARAAAQLQGAANDMKSAAGTINSAFTTVPVP